MIEAGLIGFQIAEIGAAICIATCVVVGAVITVLVARRFLK
tara:strand:- start:11405 stop:11527 length:123 start_codon:yes stop_codon:yes gene_type:complete